LAQIDSGRWEADMLSLAMKISSIRREITEYRGYSLELTFSSPQWHVVIVALLMERPAVPLEKQIVKGWSEAETLKRAKTRIDLLIESPSLN
jgi:hypothetical protein